MGRLRIHQTKEDRQAAYRQKVKAKKELIEEVVARASTTEELPVKQGQEWHRMILRVEGRPGAELCEVDYVVTSGWLAFVKTQIEAWLNGAEGAAFYGTFPYAECRGVQISGTLAVMYKGITIVSTELLEGYVPPSGYQVSEGAANIIYIDNPWYGKVL